MRRIKKAIYGIGIRPKEGSIFYSPSMAFWYGSQDANRRNPK